MSIEAYRENLAVTAQALRAATTKLLLFKQQELIYRDEDGNPVCKGEEAAKVYGDWVRCNSDWNHWASRLRMAQTEAGELVTVPSSPNAVPVQQDMRLPPEKDDEAVPF